jgi:CubicO group peptidase (beta-lactamase class C family)
MKKTFLVTLLSSVLLLTTIIQAQPPDSAIKISKKLQAFEAFVLEQMKKDKIPGLTIGFSKEGKTWVKGFGFSDLENKIPAKGESAYRLAAVPAFMVRQPKFITKVQ